MHALYDISPWCINSRRAYAKGVISHCSLPYCYIDASRPVAPMIGAPLTKKEFIADLCAVGMTMQMRCELSPETHW